ncbi:hypothetical protein VP01_1650g7 [Puccinia sorghi]|uniref:Uncharacterized protein n=1 Tax=Puccinia sorghi TaxID=27349 RepID=A0A0L6VGK3_9BASI|nr:hypothetical protein VP01_1650g7 [Puccinia sorghi]
MFQSLLTTRSFFFPLSNWDPIQKILDLEISNASLLAINGALERSEGSSTSTASTLPGWTN